MKSNKLLIGMVSLVLMFMLAACSNNSNDKSKDKNSNSKHENMKMDNKNSKMDKNMDMGNMEHSGSGEVPKGLKKAENPTYKVGSQAMVKSEHMEGMNGAE